MRLTVVVIAAIISGVVTTVLESDALAARGLSNLKLHVARSGYPSPETCTWKNVVRRREWSRLKRSEKLNYIEAVQCLGKKPAKTPAAIAAGAKTRYDDFVVTHIQQSLTVHGNGNFLSWHRFYMWAFEQTLRNECGYKGYQPYYNWAWWAEEPQKSPLLDGSDTSISGDGAYVAGRNSACVTNPDHCFVEVQPGTGGGCVKSGPFKNWKVNLGPIQNLDSTAPPNPSPDGLGYNPRCIKRDFSTQSSHETRDEFVADLIKSSANISAFQDTLQNPEPGRLRIHLGGHFTIGGDAGTDFYNSPSDPYFWFHHTMVDRIWWTWQNQEIEKRRYTIAGTLTFLNIPPSRNATIDDIMTMGEYIDFPDITIANASSTLAGPFCYIYE
ncbi:Di-copper centre-containing protein [Amniculicola lignicola CBS 123094]|uniref:Di-copper centre-containing protein n=1 Tax=Amniculicola lignicola CBS 123094 TaxID=1392246 RepID=A0A6A5WM82_9PLEO|nr:Di-copper centre-containing protein [Amniculicola lignicola CBS 123094]